MGLGSALSERLFHLIKKIESKTCLWYRISVNFPQNNFYSMPKIEKNPQNNKRTVTNSVRLLDASEHVQCVSNSEIS